MHPSKLEHYRYFAPIAWALCLGFAAFVGMLALEINDNIQQLEARNISIEERLEKHGIKNKS